MGGSSIRSYFTESGSSTVYHSQRFAVPLLFVNLLIFCVGKTIGFSSAQCGNMMGNEWFAAQYAFDMRFSDVIISAVSLDKTLNSTFWIIRHMLAAFVLIYVVNYVNQKTEGKLRALGIVATGLLVLYPSTFFIGICCMGAYFDVILEEMANKRMENSLKVLSAIAVVMLCGGQSIIASQIAFFSMSPFFEMVYSVVILLTISSSQNLQGVLEHPVMNMIESNVSSFSMYILHWPIICAVSARIMLFVVGITNSFGTAFLTNLILSSIIMVIIVWIYGNSVEKLGNRIFKAVAQ